MTRPVADKLRAARALIERGWTQGIFARRADGCPTGAESADAVCFCVVGALYHVKATYNREPELLEQAIGRAARSGLARWNDRQCRTQAEVLAAFDKAIELAEAGL